MYIEGERSLFILYDFKIIFSRHKIWGGRKKVGGHCSRTPPVATALYVTICNLLLQNSIDIYRDFIFLVM